MLREVPKASGGDRGNQYSGGKKSSAAPFATPRQNAKIEIGISQDQAKRYVKLAENKPTIEKVKVEARKNGNIVTRQAVLNAVRQVERAQKQKDAITDFRLPLLIGRFLFAITGKFLLDGNTALYSFSANFIYRYKVVLLTPINRAKSVILNLPALYSG